MKTPNFLHFRGEYFFEDIWRLVINEKDGTKEKSTSGSNPTN